MRHKYFGKKLSRTTNEKRRLFQSLVREMVVRGQIRTSVAKAKAVRGLVEKLVTKAKRADRQAVTSIERVIADRTLTKKLLAVVPVMFSSRTSGYTRLIKVGSRRGDSTEEVILAFTEELPKALPETKAQAGNSTTEKQLNTAKTSTKRKTTKK